MSSKKVAVLLQFLNLRRYYKVGTLTFLAHINWLKRAGLDILYL